MKVEWIECFREDLDGESMIRFDGRREYLCVREGDRLAY